MTEVNGTRLEHALADACRAQTGDEIVSRLAALDRARRPDLTLGSVTGTMDQDALDELLALDLGTDAVAAVVFVPLLEVLWRSPQTLEHKRKALHEAATQLGLRPDDVGYAILRALMATADTDAITQQWRALVQALVRTLAFERLFALQWELMGRARMMASALNGRDAASWPKWVFAALNAIEQVFYEASNDDGAT